MGGPSPLGGDGFFSLEPFPGDPIPSGPLQLGGLIGRSDGTLQLRWDLRGALDDLALPLPEGPPERRMALWEETCFEAFLRPVGAENYWEFNLSPAGHWNVFRLAGYRRGLTPEAAYAALPFSITGDPDRLVVDLCCPLPPGIAGTTPLTVAVTAVLRGTEGSRSHWALTHPAGTADFHHPEGFRIRL